MHFGIDRIFPVQNHSLLRARARSATQMISSTDILNARILIVDDQEANVSLLEGMLSGAGYRASRRRWIRMKSASSTARTGTT